MLISRAALVPKLEALVNVTKSLTPEILQAAIRKSLSLAKEWNARKLVWGFARYVASIMRDTYVSRTNAKRFFRIWYLEARKTGRDMPGFKECWLDFWGSIPKVKWPAGVCLDSLYAKSSGIRIQRLESLCKILSKYFKGGQFAISSYEFAERFGVNRKTIDRWRDILVKKGVLKLESGHDRSSGKSAEFSYLKGNVPQAFNREHLVEVERSADDYPNTKKQPKAALEEEFVERFLWLRLLSDRRRAEMGITS